MRILFVCLGNICRSPMAHAVMEAKAHQQGLPWTVDSCGTSGWHEGEPPHHGTLNILKTVGIDASHQQSRPLKQEDFESFDVIIGMDKQNVAELQRRCPHHHHHKIHLFMDCVEHFKGQDVPDPWYTNNFNETLSLVNQGIDGWITSLT